MCSRLDQVIGFTERAISLSFKSRLFTDERALRQFETPVLQLPSRLYLHSAALSRSKRGTEGAAKRPPLTARRPSCLYTSNGERTWLGKYQKVKKPDSEYCLPRALAI